MLVCVNFDNFQLKINFLLFVFRLLPTRVLLNYVDLCRLR